jgi:hypothetical protein
MTKTLRRTAELISGAAGAVALIAMLVAPVGAATLPSAVTGPPSAVSFTGATVSGNLNANGLVTSWAFQYGNTSALGLSTAFNDVGATPPSEVPVSAGLTGLTPGTTYFYRLIARNADGTAYGAEASLHTRAIAPTISKTSISAVSDTASQVDVEIDPHGLSTTWAVRYGTTSNFGSWSADRSAGSGVSVVNVAVALSNLSRDTKYVVQAVATNAVGTRDGAVISFSTSGAPAVVSQSSDILSPTQATLTGTIRPDGHSTRWYFQYGPSINYGLRTTIENASSSMGSIAVAHTVVGLTPNSTYQFRLVAVNADGTAVGGNATFVTPGPTLSVSSSGVVFGGKVMLSGSVPNRTANEAITVYADPTPDPSFVAVATVLTGVGGNWAYETKPKIATSYKAVWKGEISPTATVQVRPRLFLERRRNGELFTRMFEGGASLAGRLVRLQRFEHGLWRNIAARRLNRDGFATFGTGATSQFATLRAYLTAYQAGTGYLASWSAAHRFRI